MDPNHPAAGLMRSMAVVIEYLDLQMVSRPSREMTDATNFLAEELEKLKRMEEAK